MTRGGQFVRGAVIVACVCAGPLRTVRTLRDHLTPELYVFGTAGEGYAVTDAQFAEICRAFWVEMNVPGGRPMVALSWGPHSDSESSPSPGCLEGGRPGATGSDHGVPTS